MEIEDATASNLDTGIGLDIDAPDGGIEAISLQGTFLTEKLKSINVFIASIISSSGETLGIFVGQYGAIGLHDGNAGKVFRGNQFQSATLALFLSLNKGIDFWIHHGQTAIK